MEPYVAKSGHILNQFIRLGGIVHESALPINDLIAFRLINQEFIRPIMDTEVGRIYEVTEKGMAEAEKVFRQTGS